MITCNEAMIDDHFNYLSVTQDNFPPFSLMITDSKGENTFYLRHSHPAHGIRHGRHLPFLVQKGLATPQNIYCREECCLARYLPALKLLLVLCFKEPLTPAAGLFANLFLSSLAREMEHAHQIERLSERIEFGEQIVRSMSSGFLVLAPDLTITNANPAAARFLEVGLERLLGHKLSEFVLSKLLVEQIFRDGKPVIDREVVIKLANKNLHIMKTAVPMFDKQGKVIAVLDHFREIKEARQLATRITGAQAKFSFNDIIHLSESMGNAIELSKMAAGNSLSVLITGESGTGKELFAHAIHMASQRSQAPLVVIDCASLPRDLVASELFGYVDGAFTGARKKGMPGKFELADGGTVFLDELGELPLEIQAKFLRVLQTRELTRLGGKDVIPVDIRIIAATNRNLLQAVIDGHFREDLFYRLNVININVPPLRSRPEDTLLLANYFCERYCRILGRPLISISDEAMRILQERQWPGNVRELENVIARAVNICNTAIDAYHVQPPSVHPTPSKVSDPPRAGVSPATPSPAYNIKNIEQELIRQAISDCGGNISQAARQLGLARSTVYKRMLLLDKTPPLV